MKQSDIDDIWYAIFRKSPLIGVCIVLCGIILPLTFFYLADHLGSWRILVLPYISIPLGLIAGFILGIILDSIVGMFRSGDKNPKKKKSKNRIFHDD